MYCKDFKPKNDRETFIIDSSAMSHLVKSEENMTNLVDEETRVTVGVSRTLTGTKRGIWHDYHKHDVRLHHVALSSTSLSPGLYANSFIVKEALQKGFQVTL